MDQEHGNKPEPNELLEAAPHISMELQAESARVTNLTMEGTRLVLTIEAELSSSQVKATGAQTGARSVRIRDTEELTDSTLPPPGQQPRVGEPETGPGSFPNPAEKGGQPSSTVIAEEKRLEKLFSLGAESGGANFGPAGGSGEAGLGVPPASEHPVEAAKPEPAGVSGLGATINEVSYEHLEDQIRIAKSRGTTIRAERPFGERSARKADAPDETVSLSAKPAVESGDVPDNPQPTTESENDTRDIVLEEISSVSFERTTRETEGLPRTSFPDEVKSDTNTSTEQISYESLAGDENRPSVFGDNDAVQQARDQAHKTTTPSFAARAEGIPEIADDVLESLPPLPSGTKAAEPEKMDQTIRVDAADLDDSLALSDESSAVGGDRHGEPQPAMVFGCEALTAEISPSILEAELLDGQPESPSSPEPESLDALVYADVPAASAATLPAEPSVASAAETEFASPASEPAPEPVLDAAVPSEPEPAASVAPPSETILPLGGEEPEPAPSPSNVTQNASDARQAMVADAPAEEGAAASDAPSSVSAADAGAGPAQPSASPPEMDMASPSPAAKEPVCPRPGEPGGGTTVLIRYTCPKCKTQGMQAVDKVGTVVNCSNCGKAMRLVMKK